MKKILIAMFMVLFAAVTFTLAGEQTVSTPVSASSSYQTDAAPGFTPFIPMASDSCSVHLTAAKCHSNDAPDGGKCCWKGSEDHPRGGECAPCGSK